MGRQIWPQRRNLRSGVSPRSSTAANACGLLTYAVWNELRPACGSAGAVRPGCVLLAVMPDLNPEVQSSPSIARDELLPSCS